MLIGQSMDNFENWRDSQHDIPEPILPDEQLTRRYTHDYPDDTTMDYTRIGDHAELRLSFSSEDPDMGIEEMLYAGDSGESMQELVSDLRSEVTGFLDWQDSSSFHDQQGISDGIHSMEDYYGEYTRSALYAFEGILKDFEREMDGSNLSWSAIEADKKDWLYSCRTEADVERGCIGHLRGDFGRDGTEFWTSWFDHQPQLKNSEFRDELQEVVNKLRSDGGLLKDFASMRKGCHEGRDMDGSYGFHAESKNYEYCLRCTPRRGDYNFYLYCYDKAAQREQARINPDHKPVQHIPKIKKNEMER